MKLFGVANGTHFLASLSVLDYANAHGLFMQGGQPGTFSYAGYNKASSALICAEVPQSFTELINDYQAHKANTIKRQHGIWKLEDVKVLLAQEYPDIDSWDWKLQTTVWGTYGKSGKDKLKYILLNDATTEHLLAIFPLNLEYQPLITYILRLRNTLDSPSNQTLAVEVELG